MDANWRRLDGHGFVCRRRHLPERQAGLEKSETRRTGTTHGFSKMMTFTALSTLDLRWPVASTLEMQIMLQVNKLEKHKCNSGVSNCKHRVVA